MSQALTLFALTILGLDATPEPKPMADAAITKPEVWRLTLREAIKIGVDNSDSVRELSCDGGHPDKLVIVAARPCGNDPEPERLKAEVMAEVRSIEQQYWLLGQQHVQRWAAEKAVELAEDVLKSEQAELEVVCRGGNVADIAEAQQRLEFFRIGLMTKNCDVATVERGLRKLMGMPPEDARRIVPVTPPLEAKSELNLSAYMAELFKNQPDVVRQSEIVALAEKGAEGFGLDAAEIFLPGLTTSEKSPPTEARKARNRVLRERDFLNQIVHQTTRSLSRFCHEADANYQQFQTAKRFRTAAAKRLDAQLAFYNEGRITIDRYLDAVAQYAAAVSQEAQFKASYNISLLALQEAKGTLLEFDKIELVDTPIPSPATVPTLDNSAKTASFEPAPVKAAEFVGMEDCCKGDSDCTATKAGKTVSFRFSVGVGARPIEVKGSFTVTPGTPEPEAASGGR